MKAVFDVKPGSGYDDDIARCYQFPERRDYLAVARSSVGDWILYREPQRNGGRRAYIGVAYVTHVASDPGQPGLAYAFVESYLPFPNPVPFVADGRYAEGWLRSLEDRTRVGQTMQGRSMRPLAEEDFAAIVSAGLARTLAAENAIRLGLDEFFVTEFPAIEMPGMAETIERRVEQLLVNRKIRDANFRLQVCDAYENRCAVTGLRIVNGGGRAEVEAAHIKPVALGGPDIVQNGIALSSTIHWLFDRYLISISDDYRLLVAHNRVPRELTNLFRPEHEPIHLPHDKRLWPAKSFLAHHREAFAGYA